MSDAERRLSDKTGESEEVHATGSLFGMDCLPPRRIFWTLADSCPRRASIIIEATLQDRSCRTRFFPKNPTKPASAEMQMPAHRMRRPWCPWSCPSRPTRK